MGIHCKRFGAHGPGLQIQWREEKHSHQETTWDGFAPEAQMEQTIRPLGQQANPKKALKRMWRSQPKSIPEEPERPHPGIKKISQVRLSQLGWAFHMLDGESTLPNDPKCGPPRDLRVTNTQEQIQPTVVNDPSFAEMLAGMILVRRQKNTSTYLPQYTSGSAKELCGFIQHKCGLFGAEWWSRSCDSAGIVSLSVHVYDALGRKCPPLRVLLFCFHMLTCYSSQLSGLQL